MYGLPTGWESDYDGSRWIYRYIPTGLTQFTFPKPGDEFPHYDVPGAGPIAFTPEERLAYEKQLKLRKDGLLNGDSLSAGKPKAGTKDDNFGTSAASGYFDPSGFMYFEEGQDDASSTPTDDVPAFPLGFVAELSSGETLLCAEELAPVELDSSPFGAVVPVELDEMEDESPVLPQSSPREPSPEPAPLQSEPLSGPPPTSILQKREENIASSTPMQTESELLIPNVAALPSQELVSSTPVQVDFESCLPSVEALPAQEPASPTDPVATIQANPSTPRLSSSPIPGPVMTGQPELRKSPFSDRPGTRNVTAPRELPRMSVDDIEARPSSLQARKPRNNHSRSKSTSQEQWKPTIRFVQTGQLQESQVSRGPLSAGFLRHQDEDSEPFQVNRVSEWLKGQSSEEALMEPRDVVASVPVPPETLRSEVIDSVRHEECEQDSTIQSAAGSSTTQDDTKLVAPSDRLSPLSAVHNGPNKVRNAPEDEVIQSVVEVPIMQDMSTSHGLHLADIIPSDARRGAMRAPGDLQSRRKRFSWESEADGLGQEEVKDPVPPQKMVAPTPTRPLAVVQTSARHAPIMSQPSPRVSPLPSPRLPLSGNNSPSSGRITANRAVLVVNAEVQAFTATVETPDKPLPPLPLVAKAQTKVDSLRSQSKATTFDQISELIAVANAAMPAARRLTAVTSDILPRSGRDRQDTSSTLDAPGSHDMVNPRASAPSTGLHLSVQSVLHTRSVSQESATIEGWQPVARHHSRSRSMVSPVGPALAHTYPADNHAGSSSARSDGSAAGVAQQARPTPLAAYKSHMRASPTANFPYHPLRSAPLFPPSTTGTTAEEDQEANDARQSIRAPSPWAPGPTPPVSHNQTSQADRVTQRPLLQVKVPSLTSSGLPASPRPSPMFRPKVRNCVDVGNVNGELNTNKSVTIRQTTNPVLERRTSASTVSSQGSSIFSSLRDSTVSATSSMPDACSSPVAYLTAEMIALEKNQAQLIRHHRQSSELERNRVSVEDAQIFTPASSVASPPTAFVKADKALEKPRGVRTHAPRPSGISDAIRPAGTRASLWSPPKVEASIPEPMPMLPKVETPVPEPVPIPTLVVRAPTVRLKPPHMGNGPRSHTVLRASVPKMPAELAENALEKLASVMEAPQATDADVVSVPMLPSPPPVIDEWALETASTDSIPLPMDSAQAEAASARPLSFLQTLKQSWQNTTLQTPNLVAQHQGSHHRAQSYSDLSGPQGKLAEAFAIAKKRASMAWQPTEEPDQHRDQWPARESLPVNVDSISNVGAAIRFFNSSLQALRPKSETEEEAAPGAGSVQAENAVGGADLTKTTVVMRRRVGPPVIVRVRSTDSAPPRSLYLKHSPSL